MVNSVLVRKVLTAPRRNSIESRVLWPGYLHKNISNLPILVVYFTWFHCRTIHAQISKCSGLHHSSDLQVNRGWSDNEFVQRRMNPPFVRRIHPDTESDGMRSAPRCKIKNGGSGPCKSAVFMGTTEGFPSFVPPPQRMRSGLRPLLWNVRSGEIPNWIVFVGILSAQPWRFGGGWG